MLPVPAEAPTPTTGTDGGAGFTADALPAGGAFGQVLAGFPVGIFFGMLKDSVGLDYHTRVSPHVGDY